MHLNCARNVGEMVFRFHLFDATIETLFGDSQELLQIRRDRADGHGNGGVAIIPVENYAEVETYDVTFHQLSIARNAMNHFLVYRRAEGARKPAVTLECGPRPFLQCFLLGYPVEVACCYPGLDEWPELLQD